MIGTFSKDTIQKLKTLTNGKKVVFTNGCFDILHVGHSRYLKAASEEGTFLIVGVNSDASVRGLKGEERPIVTEMERAEMLTHLKWVDAAIIFDEETPYELIKAIRPDVLVKGGDWAIETIVGHDIVQANGGEVKSLLFVDGCSTTNIVEKIKSLG
jgi:rfaE bifunctional protein nucleotidyltransferase chain/domain